MTIYVVCNNDAMLSYCLDEKAADAEVARLRDEDAEKWPESRNYHHWHEVPPVDKRLLRIGGMRDPIGSDHATPSAPVKCTCGADGEKGICPYAEDVGGIESGCDCCPDCRSNCAQDI